MYIHRIISYNLGRSMSGPFQVRSQVSPTVQPSSLVAFLPRLVEKGFELLNKEPAAGVFFHFVFQTRKNMLVKLEPSPAEFI